MVTNTSHCANSVIKEKGNKKTLLFNYRLNTQISNSLSSSWKIETSPNFIFVCFLDQCISTVSAKFQGLKLTTLCLGIANTRPLAQASGEHERQQGSKTGPVSQVSFQVKLAGSKFIIKSLHQSAEKWIYKENRPHENEQI